MRGLIENLSWKLLALAIAFVLWVLLVGETELATSIPIVVQYRNVPPDLDITGDHPDRLFLKVKGPITRVSVPSMATTSLTIDLASVHGPGEQTFAVGEHELGLPPGVTLIRVVPSQIRLAFERREGKTVPVEVRYSGGPPAGYRIASEKIIPDSVRILGPELHLRRLKSAVTDPVNLSSTIGQTEFRVPVYLEDPQLKPESNAPVTVIVTLEKIP